MSENNCNTQRKDDNNQEDPKKPPKVIYYMYVDDYKKLTKNRNTNNYNWYSDGDAENEDIWDYFDVYDIIYIDDKDPSEFLD
jgi:hypothetical protein